MPEPEEKEVKPGEETPEGNTPPEEKKPEGGDGDETITVKKSEYEKTQSDRDTYRDGVTQLKIDKRQLQTDLDVAKGGKPDEGEGDGGSETTSIDETKVKEISSQAAAGQFEQIEKSNDNRAQKQFLKENPEYVDDDKWTQLMTHFTSKRGKATVEDIKDDLKSALILEKSESGTLEEYLTKDKQRQNNVDLSGAGGLGDKAEGDEKKGELSEKGKEIAQGMHVDPETAKEANLDGGNEIDVTVPRKKE